MSAPDLPRMTQVHAAALEAMRDTIAPVGSCWRHKTSDEVWQVVERTQATVLLRLPGTTRHKSGLLHLLLDSYTRETPCKSN